MSNHLFHLNKYQTVTSNPGAGTPYSGLFGEAPLERGRIFRLEVCERVANYTPEVFERVGLSVTQPIQRA